MKALLAAILCLAFAVAPAAHATDVAFSLHGERGTEGQIDGVLRGLSDTSSSDPTSISLTVTPYYADFAPFSKTYLSGAFSPSGLLTIQAGQISGSYGFADLDSTDYLNFDIGTNTFNASLDGEMIFLNPDDGISEGGFMTFDVLAAPEPNTWLLLALGLAMIGEVLRRSRRSRHLVFV